MKFYFAGSIRGGRDRAGLYAEMIRFLNGYGKVLTEHIGLKSLTSLGQEGKTDEEIYAQDTAWLKECDMVIAECSSPSLGVGYEMAYAEALGKPVHIFYEKSAGRLSAMLSGDGYFSIHYYDEEREIFDTLRKILG